MAANDLLRSQLLALRHTVDAALMALGDDIEDEYEVVVACPKCMNNNGERIEDTSAGGSKRYTCLECGQSWTLEVVANG